MRKDLSGPVLLVELVVLRLLMVLRGASWK